MKRFHPALETLESRDTPAGTVTGSFSNGTWTLAGDTLDNDFLINPTGIPNQFAITGLSGTTVAGLTNASNVKHIVVKLGAGDDRIEVNDTDALTHLLGNLRIFGGSGANSINIDDLEMQNLTIINGNNDTSFDELYLDDSIVRNNVTIDNGEGDSYLNFQRNNSSVSSIGGNLTIINGVGKDDNFIQDTYIGGDVVIKNGLPDASDQAGSFEIYNLLNDTNRSIVAGNLSVSYQGGSVEYDNVWDTEILGNVKFQYGNGEGRLYFDGYTLPQPVYIHGNLTVTGQGDTFVDIGGQNSHMGLVVGKDLTISTGAGTDAINAYHLHVGGFTTISTGGGLDSIVIDDSVFARATEIATGTDNDNVQIESSLGTSFSTQFGGPLQVILGADDDTLRFGFAGEDVRMVELLAKADLNGALGNDTFDRLHLVSVFDSPVNASFETINR